MKHEMVHMVYSESTVELPYGWYAISEIKKILRDAIKRDQAYKEMVKKSTGG